MPQWSSRPFQFTSFDAATGGNIVNQVQREYNGLGQLTREYQEHAGAVREEQEHRDPAGMGLGYRG